MADELCQVERGKPPELALPTNNLVEQKQLWGEVRITEPARDLQVTKVDVVPLQIEAAAKSGARFIELHTGAYAEARGEGEAARRLQALRDGAFVASQMSLRVNAGHGLNYHNVQPVAAIRDIVELNIGHSILARALFDGLPAAIRDMKQLMAAARA